MTPWPIFKPVILAYFLAGGNTGGRRTPYHHGRAL
jgi:hypothetical protein